MDAQGRLEEHPLRTLAANDARGQTTEEEREYLRSPETVTDWLDALTELGLDLEAQFAERRAEAQAVQTECLDKGPEGKREWFEYKARYDRWRASARRFKQLVDARRREAKRLAHEHHVKERDASEREAYRRTMQRARDFILRDQNIAPSALRERDELVAELELALWGERKTL